MCTKFARLACFISFAQVGKGYFDLYFVFLDPFGVLKFQINLNIIVLYALIKMYDLLMLSG